MQEHYDRVLDTVLRAMVDAPGRTFTHYETKYFSNWYYRQTKEFQKQIKVFVQNGLLEFVNGGWDMHDTVCPHYSDMLLNI